MYVKNTQEIIGGACYQFKCRLFGVDFFCLPAWQVKSNLENLLSGIGVKGYYIHDVQYVSI